MTDTAVDLAHLLGNLGNVEDSIHLLLGDAFTFIPEENVGSRLEARLTPLVKEKELMESAHQVDEDDVTALPGIVLDFEESDDDDNLSLRVLSQGEGETKQNENDNDLINDMRKKRVEKNCTIPPASDQTDEGLEKSDETRNGDTAHDFLGEDASSSRSVTTEREAAFPFPPFDINDALKANPIAGLSSSPFSSIGAFLSTTLNGDGSKIHPTTDSGDHSVTPTLNFIGSIFLPNEFLSIRKQQQQQKQSSSSSSREDTALLHTSEEVKQGQFLIQEVFVPPPIYLEASATLDHQGSSTSKSAGGNTITLPHSGVASSGWSTGRNALQQATNGQVIAASPSSSTSRVMSFQKAQCFKTRQCRFWLDGRCTRGDECTFAHCGNELREKPNLVKTKICSKWKLGHCSKQQHQCSYAHGLEDLRVLPSAVGGPLTPKAQVAYNDFGF